MTFELIEKSPGGSQMDPNTVSITKTQIRFSEDLIKNHCKHNYLEIYIDVKENKIGFHSVPFSDTGYKLDKKEDARCIPTSQKLKSLVEPWGIYQATYDKVRFMMVIDLNKKYKPRGIKKKSSTKKEVHHGKHKQ